MQVGSYTRVEDIDFSRYDDLNELPEIEPTEETDNMYYDEYPEFFKKVWENPGIPQTTKEYFLRKFTLSYLLSEDLKKITEGYFFLFVEGEYGGIYSTEENAVNAGYDMGYKGYQIHIMPMNPEIIFEHKETTADSHTTILNYVNKDNLPCKSIVPSYFKFDCGIVSGEIDDTIIDEIIVKDEYILDTGCTITNMGNTEYINYHILPNRYNNYPYDENKNEIIDEALRKDHLLNMKDLILYEKDKNAINSLGQVYPKIEILFKENTYILIYEKQKKNPGKQKIIIHNATYPIPITVRSKEKVLFRNKVTVDIIWPKKTDNLPGLNTILEVGGKISKSRLGKATFSLNNPRLVEGKDYYPVYQIHADLAFYSLDEFIYFNNGIEVDERTTNNNLNYFYLCREFLMTESNKFYDVEEFINNTNINLLVLENYNKIAFDSLQLLVVNSKYIDGIIFKNASPPYPITVWLKNFNVLNKVDKFGFSKYTDLMTYFSEYSKFENDLLEEYVLSEWYINNTLTNKIRI